MLRSRSALLFGRHHRFYGTTALTLAAFLGTMVPSYARADDAPAPTETPPDGANDVSLVSPELSSTSLTTAVAPTVNPATGELSTSYAFQLAPVRGPQPQLSLRYASSSGDGEAGIGWHLALPTVERVSAGGTIAPRYEDPTASNPQDATKHLEEDHFCSTATRSCRCAS